MNSELKVFAKLFSKSGRYKSLFPDSLRNYNHVLTGQCICYLTANKADIIPVRLYRIFQSEILCMCGINKRCRFLSANAPESLIRIIHRKIILNIFMQNTFVINVFFKRAFKIRRMRKCEIICNKMHCSSEFKKIRDFMQLSWKLCQRLSDIVNSSAVSVTVYISCNINIRWNAAGI